AARLGRPLPRARTASDGRQLLPFERPLPHERLEAVVRRLRPRDDEQPAGVTVEPVDDPRPGRIAAGQSTPEQALDERSARMSRARMDHETGRLVDDQKVLVLVGDSKLERLISERARGDGAQVEAELLPAG